MASKDNQTSRSKFNDGQDLVAGEKNLENAKSTSKTQVRFGEELDEDMDIRKSIQKNNAKMINIYLKTPYKVLTINEIKNKEKEKRTTNKRTRRELKSSEGEFETCRKTSQRLVEKPQKHGLNGRGTPQY